MEYVRKTKMSSTRKIPDGARKEIECRYLCEIVSALKKWSIYIALNVNFDQAASKLVPVGRSTSAKCNRTNATIASPSNKGTIATTFAVSLSGHFSSAQLIGNGEATNAQRLPQEKRSMNDMRKKFIFNWILVYLFKK